MTMVTHQGDECVLVSSATAGPLGTVFNPSLQFIFSAVSPRSEICQISNIVHGLQEGEKVLQAWGYQVLAM